MFVMVGLLVKLAEKPPVLKYFYKNMSGKTCDLIAGLFPQSRCIY
jgi:hypothetical protein